MDSANLSHLRPHQQQFGGSSSLGLPFFHGVDTNHLWNQNLIETTSSISPHFDEGIASSRDLQQQDITVPPSLNTSIFHDLGYQWVNGRPSYSNNTPYELQLMKIKEELSEPLIPKYSDSCNFGDLNLLSTSSTRHQQQYYIHDLNERQLPKYFSQIPDGDLYYNLRKNHSYGNVCTSSRGSCSRIHPSSVISSQDTSSPLSCSLGMNILAVDNWSSTSCGGDYGEQTPFSPSYLRGGLPFGLSNLAEVRQDQSSGSSQKISFINGVTAETKRAGGVTEAKPSPTPKKPRFESRSSIPPFKVRKEKLGDRIAALQQLVSPFGKTDTASVLMEAVGYIKFLQEQVETLSVPYMKSSPNRSSAAVHAGNSGGSGDQGREKESKRNLRSRGLCLVPLSCTSYFADDAGGVWSPPNFRGSI